MTSTLTPQTQEHIDLLLEVIRKNEYLLSKSNKELEKKLYNYTSRAVISDNLDFLEAIWKEMGGEIINDKSIGSFLYFS